MAALDNELHDVAVIGAGTSGGTVARELSARGLNVLLLEAGSHYNKTSYPRGELQGSTQLYWGGGVEMVADGRIGLLRPRVVGGGGVVNQALMDRFDALAWEGFQEATGPVAFFAEDAMAPWYAKAEAAMELQTVDPKNRNGNADIFAAGCTANGYGFAPLRRAQSDCHYEDGNSCVECLSGCRIDSKQSPNITSIPAALRNGAALVPDVTVQTIVERAGHVELVATGRGSTTSRYKAERVVLAAGAIGNSLLLQRSRGATPKSPSRGITNPNIGEYLYVHPQFMTVALYEEPVFAFEGPMQSYKSDEPLFRRQGFKLENVFAGPASIATMVPGLGAEHVARMRQATHLACIEVCVRDTNPGSVREGPPGSAPIIEKRLNKEDRRRRDYGLEVIRNVFNATGAKEIMSSGIGIGLHLMGGCRMGTDETTSVVGPDFTLHGSRRVHMADSSIFPSAPGINPSLSIQALSILGATEIAKQAGK